MKMEYDKQLFIVTPKKKTVLTAGAVRAAVPERFEVAQLRLAITGTVMLEKEKLVFKEPASKLTFPIALAKVEDAVEQKKLQKAYDDLLKAAKSGPANVRVSGQFGAAKDAPLSLASFKPVKTEGPGLLSMTIVVKGMT